MSPLDLEVLVHSVVRHAALTGHVVTVTDIQVARKMVTPYVFRLRTDCPCSAGVDVARQLKVYVIAYGKVISAVTQVESARVVIAETGHDDTARVCVREREETERDG